MSDFSGLLNATGSGIIFLRPVTSDKDNKVLALTSLKVVIMVQVLYFYLMIQVIIKQFFGYNSRYFCRRLDDATQLGNDADNGTEYCFDRQKSEAESTVWRYGLYNDDTGARYDLAQPGFNINTDSDGSSGNYGYASYWGIWFPPSVSGYRQQNCL